MRSYSKVLPQFWIGHTGKKIKQLGLEAQLLALYLLTCPHANMLGIYYLPIAFITHETGIPFERASKALRSLIEISFCTYDETLEYVWVHEMALYQIGGPLKPNDNRVKSLNEAFRNLPPCLFLPMFFEKYQSIFLLEAAVKKDSVIDAPSKGLRSQKQEQEIEQKNKSMSSKPDVFSLEKKIIVDPSQKMLPSSSLKNQAIEVLQFLNHKTGKAYRPVDPNLKLIIARLKSGTSVMDCRQVIAKKTRDWKSDVKMAEYLRPATLFNATKFEQYMGELVISNEE